MRHLSDGRPCGTCQMAALAKLCQVPPLRRLSGGRPCGACQVATLAALVRWPPLRPLSGGRPCGICQVDVLAALVRWPPLRRLSGGRPCGACQVAALAALVRWPPLQHCYGSERLWPEMARCLAFVRKEPLSFNSRMACRGSTLGYPSCLSVRPMHAWYTNVLFQKSFKYIFFSVFCMIHGSKVRYIKCSS